MTRVKAPNGDVYDLPEATASGLVNGIGDDWTYVDAAAATEPKSEKKAKKGKGSKTDKADASDQNPPPSTPPEGAPTGAPTATDPTGDAGDPPTGDDVDELPSGNASTAAWREYAVKNGVTQEEADGLSRDDLRKRFSANES